MVCTSYFPRGDYTKPQTIKNPALAGLVSALIFDAFAVFVLESISDLASDAQEATVDSPQIFFLVIERRCVNAFAGQVMGANAAQDEYENKTEDKAKENHHFKLLT
ncbi:MAG: hypothetical protein [Bacteriophage sp.]|nr:MAG: hypothetical protein [Bacteriophage sp.]